MARTKVDDVMISALGRRRSEIETQLAEIRKANQEADLVAEFDAIEAKLRQIDPTIPTRAEEAAVTEQVLDGK